MAHRLSFHQRELVVLAVILLCGLGLRLYGLDWDDGHYLHPDERFIAQVSANRVHWPDRSNIDELLQPSSSPINPRRDDANGNPLSYAYGSLPLYVQGVTSSIVDAAGGDGFGDYDRLYIVGRSLTAIADVVTILLVYLLGRRLFGPTGGLIGATLYAFLALPIQLSHYFTVDPWLTTFVTGSLYLALRFYDNPSLIRSLALGALVGCAFATKASVASLLVPVIATYGYLYVTGDRRFKVASLAVAGALSSIAVFTLFEPYALVRSGAFFDDIRTQAEIVRGHFDVPYTRQFVDLTPGAYELRNMLYFTTGPAFVLASASGVVLAIRRCVKRRQIVLAIPLLWIAAYVPVLLLTEARFLRYSLPLLPTLAVLAGGALATAVVRENGFRRGALQAATVVALGVTAFWGIWLASIYSSPNPRIDASEWIYGNVSPGATLTAEGWDDSLPVPRSGNSPAQYDVVSMDIYGDLPPEQKVEQLYDTLDQADYVVMSSDRVYQSVDNLPWRYAVQNEYYRRLLDGQLGFRLVYDADLRPELFGLTLDDSNADESFTVYDHPRVRIFERVEDLTFPEFRERLLWGINQPWEPSRYPSQEWLRLDGPAAAQPTNRDAEHSELLSSSGGLAALGWLVALEAIGLAALPLASLALSNSPDRGALVARLLGLLALGWLVWIGASLDFLPARTWTVVVALAGIAAVAWSTWARSRWRLPSLRWILTSFGIHLAVFGIFLGFRAYYPDFWQPFLGGEKPFELAYMRAVAASTNYPPYDPWFADGIINYYYYGWHLVATITKLTGVGVSHAFQLATPTFAAMLASSVVGLTVTILGSRLRPTRLLYTATGLALILVLFSSNLDPARQLLTLGDDVGRQFDFWGSTRVIDFTINEFPYFSFLWADVHPHLMNLPVLALMFALLASTIDWVQSRAGPIDPGLLSIRLGALALALGTALVTNAWDLPVSIGLVVIGLSYAGFLRSRRTAAALGGSSIIVAAMAYLLFFPFHARFYSVVEGVGMTEVWSPIGEFFQVWGIFLGLIVLVHISLVLRRHRALRHWGDFWLGAIVVLIAAGLTGLVFVGQGGEMETGNYLLAAFISAGVVGLSSVAFGVGRLPLPIILPALVLAVGSGVLVAPRPAAGVALAFAAAGVLAALRLAGRPHRAIPWALVAVGAAILAGVEILYVVDDLQGGPWQRMNTVFKFYLQAWLLLGVGVAMLAVRIFGPLRDTSKTYRSRLQIALSPGRARLRTTASVGQLAIAGVAGTLIGLSLIYVVVGTPVRLRQDMQSTPETLTLDGYAWMRGGSITNATGEQIHFAGDLEAIEWLDTNATGNPVILEAAIGPYRGNGSRISSATGLPTPIGWDRHQYQQRYPDDIGKRMADVRTIYNSTDQDTKLELLRRYRVRYVVVGDVERFWNTDDDPTTYASPDGLAAFEAMLGDSLELVFDQDGTRLYEVRDFPRLKPATGAVRHL